MPYIWLTVLLMQAEQWNKAREAAAKAVELDRLSTSSLFRLSSCYEAERNYESAFAAFTRAVGLLPSYEQAPHRIKLAQLKDQAADQKANVFRGDPFDILPLEIIIQIMRIGLDSNKNFVLQKSWVCRNWRSILCTRCPELWSYLSFHQWDIKDGKAAEKRQTWMRRSGNRITGLNIRFFDWSWDLTQMVHRESGSRQNIRLDPEGA
jgi:tetratricopeptide (TPR) repeat protein